MSRLVLPLRMMTPRARGRSLLTYAYQWLRCDAAGGSCASVQWARLPVYLLTVNDVGHTLRVSVSATNDGGTSSATSAAAP